MTTLSSTSSGFETSVPTKPSRLPAVFSVALLTGGADRPYAFGLATALIADGASLDLIANDELDCESFHRAEGVNFLNLRGKQNPNTSIAKKALRVTLYYCRLIRYAARARPPIFHILWNNKIEFFDRTFLMAYYRLLGKRLVLTAHNINAGKRDNTDSYFNRLTLAIQYRLCHHIFVHTEKMKRELIHDVSIPETRITVIPFGINNAVPNTALTSYGARQRLGLSAGDRVLLFFGNIAPYKGLEHLIAAFRRVCSGHRNYRLIIAGRPKNCDQYWCRIREDIATELKSGAVLLNADFIPDDETEVYFKAADVVVLPYKHIYQSGVLFLAQSFGSPVLAADVGSLKDDITEGQTGFLFRPEDPVDLANAINRYFTSDLYYNVARRRDDIRSRAAERHSWTIVSQLTMDRYARILGLNSDTKTRDNETPAQVGG